MSENLKTIKELADEFKVSKQAIRNRITTDFRNKNVQVDKVKGVNVLFINERGYNELKNHFNNDTNKVQSDSINDTNKVQSDSTNDTNVEINYLKKIIKYQNEQLEDLKNQREELSKFLDQQQRLALQDKKLLEEYKAENDNLKALNMSSQGTKEEQANNQPQEVQNEVEETTKPLRKWWQIWK